MGGAAISQDADIKRVFKCLLVCLLLLGCTTRRIQPVAEVGLMEGETIYSVACSDGDTIRFAGHRATGIAFRRTDNEMYYTFTGKGAIYSLGMIDGALADGTEITIPIDTVCMAEVDRYDGGKTFLYAISTGVIVPYTLYLGILNTRWLGITRTILESRVPD